MYKDTGVGTNLQILRLMLERFRPVLCHNGCQTRAGRKELAKTRCSCNGTDSMRRVVVKAVITAAFLVVPGLGILGLFHHMNVVC